MELGDYGTLMLRDEDFNYRHNKRLIKYLYSLFKESLFTSFKSEKDIYINPDIEIDNFLICFNNLNLKFKRIVSKLLFYQIATGLLHLHTSHIAHRDLKPDNIVFSSKDNNCKIIDFSISTFFNIENFNHYKNEINNDKLETRFLTNEPGGSIHFQAPEQFEISKHNPFISDIWSLGVSLYIFLCEEFPFDSDSELELQIKIADEEPTYPDYLDSDLKNIIKRMMEKDFNKRIGLKDFFVDLNKIE